MRKTFSSNSILLPGINNSQKNENEIINSDDILNAFENQLNIIDKNIFYKRFRKYKPLESTNYGGEYTFYKTPYNRTHFNCLKNFNIKLKLKKRKNTNNSTQKKINISGISNCSNRVINNLNHSLSLVKKVKENNDNNYFSTNLSMNNYINSLKEIYLDSYFNKILNSERKKINNKKYAYEKALKREWTNLSNDIQSFDDFKLETKLKFNKEEKLLNEMIEKNRKLNREIFKLDQEYTDMIPKIKKEIENILHYKRYAYFVHKALDDKKVNFGNLEEDDEIKKDLNKLVKEIISMFNYLLNKNGYIYLDELLGEENQGKILNIIKDLEKNIFEIYYQHQLLINDINIIKKNNNKTEKDLLNKIKNLENDYMDLLEEFENEKNKYKQIKIIQSDKFINEQKILIELLEYIKGAKVKGKQYINKPSFYFEIISPIFDYIKQKQDIIDKFLGELDIYSEEGKEIFHKIVFKIRQQNRVEKYLEEKHLNQIKNEIRRLQINQRKNQNLLKKRNKYQPPMPILKFKEKKKVISEEKTDSNDDNLIYY